MPMISFRHPFDDGILFDDSVNVRNLVAAYSAGCLFAIGWWFIIDIAAVYPSQEDFPHAYHTVGVFSTLALFMIVLPRGRDDGDGGLLCSPRSSRLIIYFGFLLGFVCVIVAMWIMFQEYVAYKGHVSSWPGVALFFQNLLIFTSGLAMKLGRVEDEDYVPL